MCWEEGETACVCSQRAYNNQLVSVKTGRGARGREWVREREGRKAKEQAASNYQLLLSQCLHFSISQIVIKESFGAERAEACRQGFCGA